MAGKPEKDSPNNTDKLGPGKSSEKPFSKPKNKDKKKAEEEVLDSWEDESVSSASDDDDDGGEGSSEKSTPADTMATVTSPSKASSAKPSEPPSFSHRGNRELSPTPHTRSLNPSAGSATYTADRRPEKHTGVANRMISHALGIRPARRTEEQRVYDRAVRENERRRIAREREEGAARRAAEEEAKKAVWER